MVRDSVTESVRGREGGVKGVKEGGREEGCVCVYPVCLCCLHVQRQDDL